MSAAVAALLHHPFVTVLAALLAEAAAAVAMYDGVDALQAIARFSGRAGAVIFGGVFLVGPFRRLAATRSSNLVSLAMRQRRRLGLAFALHHFVHLGFVFAYLGAAGREFDITGALAPAAAYALLAVMIATSNDRSVHQLGPRNWKRLHAAGAWSLWLIFLMTYVSRLLDETPEPGRGTIEFIAGALFLLSVAAIRVYSRFVGQGAARESCVVA